MANTGIKGLDVRQTGTALVFRAFLQTSAGALLGTGTTTVKLYEVQSDGTIKSYDFSDNTFKTTALTTETLALTHRPGNNAGTTTGLWTVALATLTGFTVGAVYQALVNNTGASPTDQIREFQYGSGEGDLAVTAGATGVAYLQSDTTKWLAGTIPAVNVTGVPLVDLKYTLGTLSAGVAGYVGIDWSHVNAPSTSVLLAGTTVNAVTTAVTANTTQLAGQTVTAAAGVTFPTSVASPTNITAGTITTVTNLTNAPTAGDLTAAMKASVTAAVPTAAAIATAAWQDTTAGDFTTASSPGRLLMTQLAGAFTGTGSVYTAAALANAPSGTGASAASIATAVWQDLTAGSDFSTANSIGALLKTYAAAPTAAANATAVWQDSLSGSDFLLVGSVGITLKSGISSTGVLVSPGTGTGQINLASGKVPATVAAGDLATDSITSAAVSAAAVTKVQAGLATPTNITAGTITTATNLTNAPTAGDFTSTMKTSLNAATPASVVGAVGSVTAPVATTSNVKKNQALAAFPFVMTDATTHSPLTGLTVTATRSLDGGAFASCANSPSEVSAGSYKISLAAADLNANTVQLKFAATGADTLLVTLVTAP